MIEMVRTESKDVIAPAPADGMRWIPGGTFAMGSEDFYPEERPVHRVAVDGFWMDEHPVTAAEFRRFVRETRYVTVAERPLDPERLPGRGPRAARAGLARLPQDARPGEPRRLPQLVGVRARRELEAARRARARRSTAATTTPSSTSPARTPRPTRPGPARSCRPRPSGSSPRAADSRAPSSPGATSTSRTARRWRTRGRASSRGRT